MYTRINELIKYVKQTSIEDRKRLLVEANISDEDGLPNKFFEEWRKEVIKDKEDNK